MENIYPKIQFETISLEELTAILSTSIITIPETTLSIFPQMSSVRNLRTQADRLSTIYKLLNPYYTQSLENYREKALQYRNLWQPFEQELMCTIAKYFEFEWDKSFETITAKIGLLPICPRNIEKKKFYITSDATNEDAIDTIVHECCHFAFFEKWKTLDPNWSYSEFKKPSALWYLSEIIIDPVLNALSIQKILNHKFISYKEFYDLKIEKIPLMEVIKQIYSNNSITQAILKSYDIINKNRHIFL